MMEITQQKTENTEYATIYIAGDVATATNLCREYCFKEGLCVTVTETNFVYTGGAENGVAVGLVNYPRFPSHAGEIANTARELAFYLIEGLSQHSALIVGPETTEWFSRRKQ